MRYNALMVITHLVLNDMIKVKGQVSHVASSLNDPNEHIRELAKLFFIKLSERSNNPVYNLLGDIISIFSQDQQQIGCSEGDASITTTATTTAANVGPLTKEQFQSTMHFLLSFVQKDKYDNILSLECCLIFITVISNLTLLDKLIHCSKDC